MDTIKEATREDYAAFYGRPVKMWALHRNGRVVAMGGSRLAPDGRLFAHLDVDPSRGHLWIARAIRKRMRTFPRPVFAACWEARYPTAPRLLAWLGFQPTDEFTADDKRVWVLR